MGTGKGTREWSEKGLEVLSTLFLSPFFMLSSFFLLLLLLFAFCFLLCFASFCCCFVFSLTFDIIIVSASYLRVGSGR